MVKLLSQIDKAAIADAITKAERTTRAELVTVVALASDAYQSYFLTYGLLLGSALDIGLWSTKTLSAFPWLLAIQLVVMALFSFIPCVRHLFVWLVPEHIRHHRAAHRAYEEYLTISRHVSAATPVVLLYISIAEHYAHILTSRLVQEKIPDENWNAVVNKLIAAIPLEGIPTACIKTIQYAAELLAQYFPETGQAHQIDHTVIEGKD